MGKVKIIPLLVIVILAVPSLLIIQPANAQTVPKPSIPEFTVNLFDNSFVTVSIKNQPYYPYFDPNTGLTMQFFYNIRIKNHFEADNWTELFSPEYYSKMSNSKYTNFSIPIEDSLMPLPVTPQIHYFLPVDNQTDIQVEAMIGIAHRHIDYSANGNIQGGYITGLPSWVFNGTESGWSNTQTVTIPASSISPSPTVPEFSSWTLPLLLSIVAAAAGLLVYHKKHKGSLT